MSMIFETARRIECGFGSIKKLGTLARELGVQRILVVTDPGIKKSGLIEEPLCFLRKEVGNVAVFSEVEPEPPENVILHAVDFANAGKFDGILGLGGGSSLDTAKLVALLAKTPQKLDAIYGVGLAKGPRLPLILIPTTAGTGSEVTPIAIVSTPSQEKKGVVSPHLLADVALLDPELTVNLPAHVTAATGIDALVHAIEAYTSKLLKNPISDALALQAVRLLYPNLEIAVTDGQNRPARAAMLEGSLLAGMAFANAPVAAVHALAYPLGGRFHLPHGLCNALLLPAVLRFNAAHDPSLYARFAEEILPGMGGAAPAEASTAFILALESLIKKTGIPTRLRDANIPESILPSLAAEAVKIERLLKNNPRPVALDDALALYRAAW